MKKKTAASPVSPLEQIRRAPSTALKQLQPLQLRRFAQFSRLPWPTTADLPALMAQLQRKHEETCRAIHTLEEAVKRNDPDLIAGLSAVLRTYAADIANYGVLLHAALQRVIRRTPPARTSVRQLLGYDGDDDHGDSQ